VVDGKPRRDTGRQNYWSRWLVGNHLISGVPNREGQPLVVGVSQLKRGVPLQPTVISDVGDADASGVLSGRLADAWAEEEAQTGRIAKCSIWMSADAERERHPRRGRDNASGSRTLLEHEHVVSRAETPRLGGED
jgi:hypothetical protein